MHEVPALPQPRSTSEPASGVEEISWANGALYSNTKAHHLYRYYNLLTLQAQANKKAEYHQYLG